MSKLCALSMDRFARLVGWEKLGVSVQLIGNPALSVTLEWAGWGSPTGGVWMAHLRGERELAGCRRKGVLTLPAAIRMGGQDG
jgi:hypothetical protein